MGPPRGRGAGAAVGAVGGVVRGANRGALEPCPRRETAQLSVQPAGAELLGDRQRARDDFGCLFAVVGLDQRLGLGGRASAPPNTGRPSCSQAVAALLPQRRIVGACRARVFGEP